MDGERFSLLFNIRGFLLCDKLSSVWYIFVELDSRLRLFFFSFSFVYTHFDILYPRCRLLEKLQWWSFIKVIKFFTSLTITAPHPNTNTLDLFLPQPPTTIPLSPSLVKPACSEMVSAGKMELVSQSESKTCCHAHSHPSPALASVWWANGTMWSPRRTFLLPFLDNKLSQFLDKCTFKSS